MRALVKTCTKPGLTMQDIPEPSMGPDDVKIKINKTAICGTDLHIYRSDPWPLNDMPLPLNTGHEFVGEIIEVGPHVTNFKIGDRVSGEGHIVCEFCRNCRAGRKHMCLKTLGVGVTRPGAFAEFLVIPASNAYHIPDNISDDLASILDPLGNAVHTALAFDIISENVLITGAGPIGIMGGIIANFVGARSVVITDVNDERLALAKSMGLENTVNPNKTNLKDVMDNLNMEEGFDVGFEMSGNGTAMNDMIDALNNNGKISLLGISAENYSLDWNKIVLKGLTIKGIYGRLMYETWHKMVGLLQRGLPVAPIITDTFPAADFEKGFTKMQKGQCGKVILDWMVL
jgi:threonine 3-dehydrogenase